MEETTVLNFVEITKMCDTYRSEETRHKIAVMEKNGFKIIYTDENTILLDLDDNSSLEHYDMILPLIQKDMEIIEKQRWVSKSGKGLHVVLKTPDCLTPLERITLQSILGSDRKREYLSFDSIRRDLEPEPKYISILFQPPEVSVND